MNINKINGAIKQKKLYSTKSSLFALLKKTIRYSRDKEKQHKTSFESSEFLMCFPSPKKEAFIEMLAVRKQNQQVNFWCSRLTVGYGARLFPTLNKSQNGWKGKMANSCLHGKYEYHNFSLVGWNSAY